MNVLNLIEFLTRFLWFMIILKSDKVFKRLYQTHSGDRSSRTCQSPVLSTFKIDMPSSQPHLKF